MLLVKSDNSTVNIELAIMNSHPDHNLISEGRKFLTEEDILSDHKEEDGIEKERYLIKKHEESIGILDFTMENPKDKKPWLGLFIIHKEYEGTGLSQEAYMLYENLMKSRNVLEVRLGCYQDNVKGQGFWKRNGFNVVRETEYKNKTMLVLEKVL